MTTRIYLASKLYMAEAWRELRLQQVDLEFTSSWIDLAQIELDGKATPEILSAAWHRNVLDVAKADALIVYAGAEDVLVGGLIEAGVGIGLGKTVICTGTSKSFGTWIQHDAVYKTKTVMEAIALARKLHP